ncbi:peptide deformylase [Desulfitispora alkaliphila]|uniref:peptide deformylase n=1 Tax=Desulfitispora alkaliphila TaxID=622674 RepID=UPI003D2189D7
MAVYNILKSNDPLLREKSVKVNKINSSITKLLDNMADTMYDAEGVGLAAPQIGVSKRVIVVDVGEGLIELINPEIIKTDGQQNGIEGCLSVPGVQGEVVRPDTVEVEGVDRNGKKINIMGSGLLARALLHEIDHLNGVLFVDKADKINKE